MIIGGAVPGVRLVKNADFFADYELKFRAANEVWDFKASTSRTINSIETIGYWNPVLFLVDPNFCAQQVKEQDCISSSDPRGEKYHGIINTAGGLTCMKWNNIWQPTWNSKLTHPNDGFDHNYCRNIIGSQFQQPWCMVKKPIEGPTAVQCSIPKCSQRQPQIDVFPTALPMLILSTAPTTSASDYTPFTDWSTVRPASKTTYMASSNGQS